MSRCEIPLALRGRPFTTADAARVGVSRRQLQGPRFVLLHSGRGVWAVAHESRDLRFWLAADRLVLPSDAAVSYQTGLRLYGAPLDDNVRHWTTLAPVRRTARGVVLHRRADLPVRDVDGIAVLAPLRCLLDAALVLSPLSLIRAGDALLTAGELTLAEIRGAHSAYGVQRLRQASRLMRVGAESVRETSTRLILGIAGLPEPVLNRDVWNASGVKIGRPDLLWEGYGVTAEYDGWYHERDADQRQADILRSEAFARAGLFRVALTSRDHAQPQVLVDRVWQALADRGYRGERPRFDVRAWQCLLQRPRMPKVW